MSSASVPPWEALFARRAAGIKLDLAPARRVYEALGRPGATARVVRVVGTNGKGTTCAFVARALAARGARVGLYTSPHLERVTERVRVDGAEVAEPRLVAAVGEVLAAEAQAAPRPLTFFELLTLAALVTFAGAGVDLLVLEAGLGGRLDATSVVPAGALGVARIALDHTQWLGPTLAHIAREKAGAMTPGRPVWALRPPAGGVVADVLAQEAAARGCPLTWVTAPGCDDRPFEQNRVLALTLARAMDPGVTVGDLGEGLPPGRCEPVPVATGPDLLLDVAHNPDAARALVRELRARGLAPAAVALGCRGDKDGAGLAAALSELGAPVVWVDPPGEDGAPPPDGVDACYPDWPHAWAELRRRAGAGPVLVTGGHALVGHVRAWARPTGEREP